MLQQILYITGLEARLQALKTRIEDEAERIIDHGKAVARQTAIAAALGVAALVVALMAFAAGMVALFLWLEPQVGSLGAAGIVAAALVAVAVTLAVSATVIMRKDVKTARPASSPHTEDETPNPPGYRDAARPMGSREPPPVAAAPLSAGVTQDAIISQDQVRSILSVVGTPKVGIEPIDQLVQTLAPKAEEAAAEAIGRAANVVRNGDRSAMLAVLGTAMAIGWLVGVSGADFARRSN